MDIKYTSDVLHQNLVHSNISLYQKRHGCYIMFALASRYSKLPVYEFWLINITFNMIWNKFGYAESNKVNE